MRVFSASNFFLLIVIQLHKFHDLKKEKSPRVFPFFKDNCTKFANTNMLWGDSITQIEMICRQAANYFFI